MNRQLEPIWDAIDDERFGHALQLIEKTQKRYRTPNLTLLGLQGLCLARENRIDEALSICEELRADAPKDKNSYQTIHDILKSVSNQKASNYLISTMASGYTLTKSEFMGRMWFMESVRAGDVPSQRKAAMELQKGFVSRNYFYLVLVSMRLLYEHGEDAKDKSLLGVLMYRMISKAAENHLEEASATATEPRIDNIEEFYLYLDILQLLGKYEEALKALCGPLGKLYDGSHDLLLLKLELLEKTGEHKTRFETAKTVLESGTDDWLIVKAYIDSSHAKSNTISKADFTALSGSSKTQSRNSLLACIYLASKLSSTELLLQSLKEHIRAYGDKLTTFEDLTPYVQQLHPDLHMTFIDFFLHLSKDTIARQTIAFTNYMKFNIFLRHKDLTSAELQALATTMLHKYTAALHYASDLKPTDNQYGDDIILLAARIQEASNHGCIASKLLAIVTLEQALLHSKHNYRIRLSLVRLYRQIGAWSQAHAHYRELHVKHIQHDTLSFLLLEQASYEYCSTLQISRLYESQSIYASSKRETPDAICQAYENGTYSKIPEFLEFQRRLDRSLWQFQAQANIWSLEILLDKFVYTQSIDVTRIKGSLYDNKNRGVMSDILAAQSLANSDHAASESDVEALKVSYYQVQMLQAILRNKRIENPADVTTSDQARNSVYNLVRALYDIKFNTTEVPAAMTRLGESVDALTIPETLQATDLSSDSLHQLGKTVESLKLFSIISPHIKSDLKAIKFKVQALVKQVKPFLEKLRLDIMDSKLSIDAPEGLVVEPAFIRKILDNVKLSRRESVTCLLSVVKSIK